MKKLYKIKMKHYAPKDYEYGIKEYVVAEDDKEVFKYISDEYSSWEELDEETQEEILEEQSDDFRELYDLYYGATKYEWEEVGLVDDSMMELMLINKLARDIR